MKTEIAIRNLQKKVPIKPSQLTRTAKKILAHERVLKATLSVVFVTDSKIKSLNRKYLRRNHPTDVLAFDLNWQATLGGKSKISSSKKREIVGEIVVSVDTAKKNARIYKTNIQKELTLYLAHGILHLLGYDDLNPKDSIKMRAKERKLLNLIYK